MAETRTGAPPDIDIPFGEQDQQQQIATVDQERTDGQQPRRPVLVAGSGRTEAAEREAELETSGEIDKLLAALARAQGNFGDIERSLTAKIEKRAGGSFSYKYAPLDEVLQAVRKALADEEVSVMQFPVPRARTLLTITQVGHSSGQFIRHRMVVGMVSLDPKDVRTASTYARRTALESMLGVAPGYDDDAQSLSHYDQASAQAPQPAARRSSQRPQPATAAPEPTAVPADEPTEEHTGAVVGLAVKGSVARVELSDGFKATTSSTDVIKDLKVWKDIKNSKVTLTVRPPHVPDGADATRYYPVIVSLKPCVGQQ